MCNPTSTHLQLSHPVKESREIRCSVILLDLIIVCGVFLIFLVSLIFFFFFLLMHVCVLHQTATKNIRTRTQDIGSLPGPKPLFSWEENPLVSFLLLKLLSWSMWNPRPLTRRSSKNKSSPSFSLHYVFLVLCSPPFDTSFPWNSSFFRHFVLPSIVSRSSRRDTFT